MPVPDEIILAAAELLRSAPDLPAGLPSTSILTHEELPLEPEELPAVGLYLVVDQMAESASGLSNRTVTLQVQINTIRLSGHDYLSATRSLRAWVLRRLLPNQEEETGLEGAEHLGTRPGFIPSSKPVAVALIEISIPFFHDPFQEA